MRPVEHRTNGPSLADLLAYEALPDDVKALVARVRGYTGSMGGGYSREDMVKAYEAGFDDACEQFERPYCHREDAEDFLASLAR